MQEVVELTHRLYEHLHYRVLAKIEQTDRRRQRPRIEIGRVIREDNPERLPVDTIVMMWFVWPDEPFGYVPVGIDLERILNNPEAFLRYTASVFSNAALTRRQSILELCAWGIKNPSDFEVTGDYDGPCVILKQSFSDGYTPYSYLPQEDKDAEFASPDEAKCWADIMSSGDYILGSDEVDRPRFYVLPAEGLYDIVY